MTAFNKSLAAINLLGAIVSIALLMATWFAQGLIVGKAKEYALDATRKRLEPVVRFLEHPKLAGKLPASVEERLRGELADYQQDPERWLLEVAEASGDRAADFEFPEVRNPLARKGLEFLGQRVSQASEHFRKSYANLIIDLRIFCGTNAFAFLLAAWLCFVSKTKPMRYWLGAWSASLLLATLLGVWTYLGQNWFWNITLNSYLGWAYASLHALVTLWLFYKLEPTLRRTQPAHDD
jgi:hypothetical protein